MSAPTYEELVARARAGAGEHDRSGQASMFTSSKAYNTLPFAPRGHPGLWCGPLAAGDGYLRRPAYDTTRSVVRGGVWPQPEREVNPFTAELFAYGNRMEPIILRWLGQLPDTEAAAEAGRLHHPTLPWMSSTPDAILRWRGRVLVGELKAPTRRRVQAGPTRRWVRSRDGAPFRQENCLVDVEEPEGEAGEEVERSWRQEVVELAWDEILLVEGSKVPAHYLVQCTLHCICAGVQDALIVQAEPGGLFHPPTLHVTHWQLDADLLAALLPYWTRVWALVEEGRLAVRLGERLSDDWPWVRDGDKGHTALVPFDWTGPAVRRLEDRRRVAEISEQGI